MCYFGPAYYLKATFGAGIDEAVLEIPVSLTGNKKNLIIAYQISSPKIKLVVRQSKGGNVTDSMVLKYTGQKYFDTWNFVHIRLDSDVEAIQLVARKTGVTTNVEYVLVDDVETVFYDLTGNMPLVYKRKTKPMPMNPISM